MSRTLEATKSGRNQRHSAAWGKRLATVVLLLVAEAAIGQNSREVVGKFAPDLAAVLGRAQQSAATQETAKLIVQYHQAPHAKQEARVQRLGAHLKARLGLVNGIAMTIPISALPALAADAEVASIHLDHPLKGMDATTNAVVNVPTAWKAGLNGAGIGVAVIDSGIMIVIPIFGTRS